MKPGAAVGMFALLAWMAVCSVGGCEESVGPPQQKGSRQSVKSKSAEARNCLREVLSGARPPPEIGNNLEAWRRYFNAKRQWFADLSLDDCVVLVEECEKSRNGHYLKDGLYARYGELAPKAALARVVGPNCTDYIEVNYLGEILEGWSKNEPEKVWDYLNSLPPNPMGRTYRDEREPEMLWSLFGSWVKKDHETAYKMLLKVSKRGFERAACGYYANLPENSDFPNEARKVVRLVGVGCDPLRKDFTWGSDPSPQHGLPLMVAKRWMRLDPRQAMAWWIRIGECDSTNRDDWLMDRKARLVAALAGEYESYNPDLALRWVKQHANELQSVIFQDRALAPLAKYRPEEVFSLIGRIKDKDRQSYLLHTYVREESFEGEERYRRWVPSALLPCDLVEKELGSFGFNEEQEAGVKNAIESRRKAEAAKPAPTPCDW